MAQLEFNSFESLLAHAVQNEVATEKSEADTPFFLPLIEEEEQNQKIEKETEVVLSDTSITSDTSDTSDTSNTEPVLPLQQLPVGSHLTKDKMPNNMLFPFECNLFPSAFSDVISSFLHEEKGYQDKMGCIPDDFVDIPPGLFDKIEQFDPEPQLFIPMPKAPPVFKNPPLFADGEVSTIPHVPYMAINEPSDVPVRRMADIADGCDDDVTVTKVVKPTTTRKRVRRTKAQLKAATALKKIKRKPPGRFEHIFSCTKTRGQMLNNYQGVRVRLSQCLYEKLFKAIQSSYSSSMESFDIFAFQAGSAIGPICLADYFGIDYSNIYMHEPSFSFGNIGLTAVPLFQKLGYSREALLQLRTVSFVPPSIKQQILFISSAGISLDARRRLISAINNSSHLSVIVAICSNQHEFNAIFQRISSQNITKHWIAYKVGPISVSNQSLYNGFMLLTDKN